MGEGVGKGGRSEYECLGKQMKLGSRQTLSATGGGRGDEWGGFSCGRPFGASCSAIRGPRRDRLRSWRR